MNHVRQFAVSKTLLALSLWGSFLPGLCQCQVTPGPTSQTTAVSGSALYFGNGVGNRTSLYQTPPGNMTATFEELITGSPATVSIVINGCMRGGTCELLDTYTTVANADRSPSLSKIYDYFSVTQCRARASSDRSRPALDDTSLCAAYDTSLAPGGQTSLGPGTEASSPPAKATARCSGSPPTVPHRHP